MAPVDITAIGMASGNWTMILRSYSDEELAAFVANLKSQITIFSQQSIGSKSFTRDLNALEMQLSSAIYVQRERSSGFTNPCIGITDFSGI